MRQAHDFTSTELGGGGELVYAIPTFCSGAIFGGKLNNPPNSPITLFSSIIDTASRTESNEFTATAKTKWADVIAASITFMRLTARTISTLHPPGYGVFHIVNGIPTLPGYPGANGTVGRNDNTDLALYGQITGHITDQLDVQGGIRWSNDTREYVSTQVFPPVTFRSSLYRFDWMAKSHIGQPKTSWPTPRSRRVLCREAFSAPAPFGPEKLTEPEVGLKADLLDNACARIRRSSGAITGSFNCRRPIRRSRF